MLNLIEMFNVLEKRPSKQILTYDIIKFMQTELDQKYRRSKNSLYWFQLFINGSWLENAFKQLNNNLEYIEDNHGILGDKKRGNFVPDFRLTVNNTSYTVDTKTFYNIDGFNNTTYNNLEGADIVVAFIIKENTYFIRQKIDGTRDYTVAYDIANLPNNLQKIINKINFPKIINMIRFDISKDTEDQMTPAQINYWINTYRVL